MGKSSLHLDWCSHEAAKYAVMNWHYSKKMPVNKLVKIGVWENQKFIGALVFGCGSAGVGAMGKRFGLSTFEVAELSRVALTRHENNVTRIVSIALRMLKKSQPKLKMVVSYADPEQDHHGGIYQAGNWIYIGRSSPDFAYVDHHGKRWHSRSVSETGYKVRCGVKTRCPKPSTMEKVRLEEKYKYVMALDEETREKVEPLRKPYPKK